MWKYINGDPRFKRVSSNRKRLVLSWANKEFLNLKLLHWAGVRVPEPVVQHDNIVVMEYIGDDIEPARQLKYVQPEDPEGLSMKVMSYVRLAYQKAKLVHCDLSEFNILMFRNEPVLIDVGQGVLVSHANAEEWLERDVRNMVRYFGRHGVKMDVAEELKVIRTP
jgi:RIO kinase 1